ncbi:MAG: transglycosylase family protein [Nitriliruptorales bacterium]
MCLPRMGSSLQRRLSALRPRADGPVRRAARMRGVLLGMVVALIGTSPPLQVSGWIGDARPEAAPGSPPAVPIEGAPVPAQVGAPDPIPPVSVQPVAFQPETVRQHRIQVDGVQPNALHEARTVEGVAFATALRIGDVPVVAPAGLTPVRVAAVDPGEFRVLTPQQVADTIALWENVVGGDAVLTHEGARKLGAQLGQPVTTGGGLQVRVGAIATNTTPPVAEAVVDTASGDRLGLAQLPQALLVAVHDGAIPEDVARRLEQRLHAKATVIPDPRAPRPVPPASRVTSDNVWDLLAMCESGGNWHINTGNGYYGGLQFLPESWYWVGGKGLPHEASREEQIYRAKLLLALQGWKAWPACSLKLGLRQPDASDRVAAASAARPGPAPRPEGSAGSSPSRSGPPPPASQPQPSPPPESNKKKGLLPLPPLP